MTEELVKDNEVIEALENNEELENEELDFVKEITLEIKGAEKQYSAPRVVNGRVNRQAISLKYKERKLKYKNDGKGNYEKDEDGNYIEEEITEEIEFKTLDLYEDLAVSYFNNQFTKEELQEGLDARIYLDTLYNIYFSALGNRTVQKKK